MGDSESEIQRLRDTVAALRQLVAQTACAGSPALQAQREALLDPAVNENYAACQQQLRETQEQLARCQARLADAARGAGDELVRLRERCAALEAENRALREEQGEGAVQLLRAACDAQQAQILALKAACIRANDAVDRLTQQNRRLVEQLDSVQSAPSPVDDDDGDDGSGHNSPKDEQAEQMSP